MRFVEALLDYDSFLGDIFQGQDSFAFGGMSELEKQKAVGAFLGEQYVAISWLW